LDHHQRSGHHTGWAWSVVHASSAAPRTVHGLTALDAALARPDRRVTVFQADGGGIYTLQAVWSMATETGERFFGVLVTSLSQALGTRYACLTEYMEAGHIVLVRSDPRDIPKIIALSRAT
jgi:hypothetical protein